MRSRRSGPERPSGDTEASGRRVTRKAPSAHVEEGQAAPRHRPQPFSRILTAWKVNSANFAKNSSPIHCHLLVCWNNDVKDQPALRVDRGLRPIRDDLTSGLPPGYHLDLLSDPCVIILRRSGETVVARFTPFADPQEIRRIAEEDRARLEVEPDG